MNSRTAGAPSLPVASEEEMALADIKDALANGDITPEQYAQMVASLGARRAGVREQSPPLAQSDEELRMRLGEFGFDDPRTRAAARAAFIAEGVDNVRRAFAAGDERAAARGRARAAEAEAAALGPGPRTGSYEDYAADVGVRRSPTWRMEQEGQDMADARAYGVPAGGGAPFRSQAEAEAYGERNVLSQDERNALAAEGMTPGQIVDRQRSGRDRDMAKAGRSGSSGWAPVYTPQGTVTYLERAPDFSRDSVHELGMTNAAEGNQRTGERVASGELSRSLNRPDLEERGYVIKTVPGPYGMERVWVKDDIGERARAKMAAEGDTEGAEMSLADYQQRQQMARQRRRLLDAAGVSSTQAEGQSMQQLRDLIADNRAASKRDQAEVNRRARMAAPYRRELAFSELGGPNQWQNAVTARQFGMSQTTPLDVEAANAEEAIGIARSMVQGMEGEDGLRTMMFEQQQARDAAAEAVKIGEEMGVTPSGRGWLGGDFRGTQDQLDQIAERVESQFPGFGERSVRGWAIKPPRPPAPVDPGSTGMPAAGPAPPNWPIGKPWPPRPR